MGHAPVVSKGEPHAPIRLMVNYVSQIAEALD